MQILDIKEKKWMIGLEWEILPNDAQLNKESKEVAEKTNSKFGILVEYDSTFSIGLTKKLTKFPCAALYLALANQSERESNGGSDYPDWIIMEEVGEDRYWMSVIKSGIPAPQFDTIVSITEIKERMTELLINDTYTVFTSSNEIINIFEGIKHIEKKSINELTQDVKTKIKFKKLLGIPNSVIYTGLGLIGFCAVAFAGLQFVEGKSLEEKSRIILEQQAKQEQEKIDLYNKELKDYEKAKLIALNTEKNKVIAGLSGNPAKILEAFYNDIGSSTVVTSGWDLKEIECYYNPEKSQEIDINNKQEKNPIIACDYLYKRGDLGTTRMLLEDFPSAKINGDKAIVTNQINIDPKFIKIEDESILDNLKNAKNWGLDVQSQLQLLKVANIEHEINSSNEIKYTFTGAPLTVQEKDAGKSANQPETQSLGIGFGEILVRGDNFDLIKELADNVDFSGTGLKKINFKVNGLGSINWIVTFNYYIKTVDGGIGASTSKTQEQVKETK